MLSVGDRVTNDLKVVEKNKSKLRPRMHIVTHILQENLQNATSLFVDKTRDTLDTTTTSKTTNSLGTRISKAKTATNDEDDIPV